MSEPGIITISDQIRSRIKDLNFDLCGFAPASVLSKNAEVIDEWCRSGMNAGMSFFSRNIEKRSDPALLFPGTKSVIVTGLSYNTEHRYGGKGIPGISRYALGANYHDLIIGKLTRVAEFIGEICPGSSSRAYVDTAPIFEKAWAERAGIGWQGKHSVVVNEKTGSFFFIGIILTDIELAYDEPARDKCGSCRACFDSCPTGAINDNRTIDARKCIAFLTIESKEPVSKEQSEKFRGLVFGCDICQEACPWNKHAPHHSTPEFEISDELSAMSSDDWRNLDEDKFRKLFGNSAIGRKSFGIFLQNVTNVTK